ncbi:hemerythrin domain-containing protein [Vitiosangium sp. GDMCC 1.1324]|uniref:hemerythrin domain-containing protein n=1 Tax=Vitiosangium sp. (strain GDMCC 1.1324) TaxID=2138576 RepID=UPI000D3CDE56|nr:hemerythrin domain-containing protein [Vitiosangium sp. GDMCC 1.1324]PTL85695.1 hypothetical protein DAT35_03000 [Vitiosangium sp. GDMCC 1.1324]
MTMKSEYERFALGMRYSHAALLRNLDRFASLAEESPRSGHEELAAFVGLFVEFLDVHHRGEDDFFFPALRKHSPGRSTDGAHLEQWSREHRDVAAASAELASASARLARGDGQARREIVRRSLELKEFLRPHLRAEEEILEPRHLAEMLPEVELAQVSRASARANRSRGLRMAMFLVHSLDADEQTALFGEQPWFFRKLLVGIIGRRRMVRFRPLVYAPEIAL